MRIALVLVFIWGTLAFWAVSAQWILPHCSLFNSFLHFMAGVASIPGIVFLHTRILGRMFPSLEDRFRNCGGVIRFQLLVYGAGFAAGVWEIFEFFVFSPTSLEQWTCMPLYADIVKDIGMNMFGGIIAAAIWETAREN